MPNKKCKMPECDGAPSARGLCRRCYQRASRAGDLEKHPTTWADGKHSLTHVDTDSAQAICAICGPVKIRVRRDGKAHECQTVRKRNSGESRASRIRRKYGLDPDGYARLWMEQGGRCAICVTDKDLYVDHCHSTGRVRGLLCHTCNTGIGFMQDDAERLRRAAQYVS